MVKGQVLKNKVCSVVVKEWTKIEGSTAILGVGLTDRNDVIIEYKSGVYGFTCDDARISGFAWADIVTAYRNGESVGKAVAKARKEILTTSYGKLF